MILKFTKAALTTVVASLLTCSSAFSMLTSIGSGPDTSYFTLESPNIGIQTFEINYDFNESSPQDSFFLLDMVLNDASTGISANISNFGSTTEPNFIVESITFSGVTETNTSGGTFTPFWVHWVAGGEAGFPTASPVASNSWTSGSGISGPFRLIAPGSNDALRYGDFVTTPSITPVPEPSSSFLALASIAAFCLRRKRHQHE